MTLVREFHEAFGHPAPAGPPLRPNKDRVRLRLRLIREEFKEVEEELEALLVTEDPDALIQVYRRLLKELSDLRYVTDGCAVEFGLPIDGAFAEVHASNMSKLGRDGRPILRDDGKVLKGEDYFAADMAHFVETISDAECSDE